jgi:hypothetical protein
MRFLNILLLLTICFTFSSCKKTNLGDCFKSTGKIIEQERDLGEISRIIIHDNVNVVFTHNQSKNVIVSAGENIIDKIITEKNGDTLDISNTNSCNWVRDFSVPITVYLPGDKINKIDYRSIGNISCADTIFCDSLFVDVYEGAGTLDILVHSFLVHTAIHYGTAEIQLSGICNLCFVYSAGWGLIDNRDLISNQVYVGNKSSNDIYLHAERILAATCEGIGNIYYFGTPENISFNQIGSGKLIKLDN